MTHQRPESPPNLPAGALFQFGNSPFRVKGVLYLGTQSFFDSNIQGGFAAFVADIQDGELSSFISQRFLASSWYDVMPAPGLITYEARALRMTVEQYLLHRTRWQAKKDLGGVYGWALKLASPNMVFSRLPKVFTSMFDFVRPIETTLGQGTGQTAFSGIPTPLVPWLTTSLGVYLDTALKLAGARKVDSSHTTAPEGFRVGVEVVRVNITATWM
jgi:hypothetical protein